MTASKKLLTQLREEAESMGMPHPRLSKCNRCGVPPHEWDNSTRLKVFVRKRRNENVCDFCWNQDNPAPAPAPAPVPIPPLAPVPIPPLAPVPIPPLAPAPIPPLAPVPIPPLAPVPIPPLAPPILSLVVPRAVRVKKPRAQPQDRRAYFQKRYLRNKADPEWVAKRNLRNSKIYAEKISDPEYVAKQQPRLSQRYVQSKNDPDFLEKHRQRNAQYRRDPANAERYKIYSANQYIKNKADPEWVKKKNAENLQRYHDKKNKSIAVASVFFLAVFLTLPSQAAPKSHPAERAVVVGIARAMDGDSLRIGKIQIRLQGIDAVEWDQKCGGKKIKRWHCGKKAGAEMMRLVEGKKIYCEAHAIDTYRRVVATCRVRNKDIARAIVLAGYALAGAKKYRTAHNFAKNNRKGIWKSCFALPSRHRKKEWRCTMNLPKNSRKTQKSPKVSRFDSHHKARTARQNP